MALCPVCGLSTPDATCPRCETVLEKQVARCATCGKAYPGRVALCPTCRPGVAIELDEEQESTVRAFALVPGVGERTARNLYTKGFRDFADVIKLGLPEGAAARGLHHTITRKLLMASVAPKRRSRIGRSTCPECRVVVLDTETKCPACGAPLSAEAEQAFIERRLSEVHGPAGPIREDPDFQSMPAPVKSEILEELGSFLDETAVPDAEFQKQLDAWRAKGFDVDPILMLLAQHPSNFRERAVRLIRMQIRKRMEGGLFRCPLCEEYLESTAEECGNCGAKFA